MRLKLELVVVKHLAIFYTQAIILRFGDAKEMSLG